MSSVQRQAACPPAASLRGTAAAVAVAVSLARRLRVRDLARRLRRRRRGRSRRRRRGGRRAGAGSRWRVRSWRRGRRGAAGCGADRRLRRLAGRLAVARGGWLEQADASSVRAAEQRCRKPGSHLEISPHDGACGASRASSSQDYTEINELGQMHRPRGMSHTTMNRVKFTFEGYMLTTVSIPRRGPGTRQSRHRARPHRRGRQRHARRADRTGPDLGLSDRLGRRRRRRPPEDLAASGPASSSPIS